MAILAKSKPHGKEVKNNKNKQNSNMEKESIAEVIIASEKEELESKSNTSMEEASLSNINKNVCSLETTINVEKIKDIIVEETDKMGENVLEENIANLSIEKTNTDDEQSPKKGFPTNTNSATDTVVFIKPVVPTIALNMLSQYSSSEEENSSSSEDETDETSGMEEPNIEYRNRSSSSSDDDESICSEANSEMSTSVIVIEHEKKRLNEMDAEISDDDDDGNDNIRSRPPLKVKGEFTVDDLPPIEHLHISIPSNQCVVLGKVKSIIDQLVLVDSIPGTVPLNLDTLLFLEEGRTTLGKVFDVIGQISDPLYCIRFNSNKEIQEKGIAVGMPVYCAPQSEYTSFIILSEIMKYQGSDASWKNDIEPPEKYVDYSDDEQERSARKSRRGYIQDSVSTSTNDDESVKKQRNNTNSSGRGRFHNRRNYNNNFPHNMNQSRPNNNRFRASHNFNYGHSWHNNFQQNATLHYDQQQHQQPGPSYINPYAIAQNIFRPPPPPPPAN